jgi:hypothetical protein
VADYVYVPPPTNYLKGFLNVGIGLGGAAIGFAFGALQLSGPLGLLFFAGYVFGGFAVGCWIGMLIEWLIQKSN